eukprot:scaffold138340_cov28-Tisochrysis_lutea.AAC.1
MCASSPAQVPLAAASVRHHGERSWHPHVCRLARHQEVYGGIHPGGLSGSRRLRGRHRVDSAAGGGGQARLDVALSWTARAIPPTGDNLPASGR